MNQLICLPKTAVALTGATFDPDLAFEDWAHMGKQLVRGAETLKWLIGDWINFGWQRYVETAGADAPVLRRKYKVALEALPYQYQSLANFSWVSKSIEFSRRREKLSWSHHAEVAGLALKEQEKFLSLAEKNDLSVADLREAIRRARAEVDDDSGPPPLPSPNHWTNQLSLWLARVADEDPPERWPRERLEIFEQDLRPVGEFYTRVRNLIEVERLGSRSLARRLG